jgi:hypothetical protein
MDDREEPLFVAYDSEGNHKIDQCPPEGGVRIPLAGTLGRLGEPGTPACFELRIAAGDELRMVTTCLTGTMICVEGQTPDPTSIIAVPRPCPWEVKQMPDGTMVGFTLILTDPPVQGRRVLCLMERGDARELMAALALALDRGPTPGA